MRRGRLLAAIAAPIFAVACATGSAPVLTSGDDGGGGGAGDASSYGADATVSDGGAQDSGVTHIDSGGGGTDSGGGGGGGGVTPGGDCIGDPGAPFGYDFECEFDESFGDDEPCTPDAGMCGAGLCCFTDTSSQCYTDYGTQCVTVAM